MGSFVHFFAAGARAGWRPDGLLDMWESYLLNETDTTCRMYPNGMVLGCGKTGLENVGGTVYINEMLLQSHMGAIRVFPTLPARLGARFRLRAVGGFMVSAARDAFSQIASPVTIEVPQSQGVSSGGFHTTCSIFSPWGG